MDIAKLRPWVRLFERHQLTELVVESGDLRVALRRGSREAPQEFPPGTAPSLPPVVAPAAGPALLAICSPLLGVFYRSPAPDRPPFVEVGDLVRAGDTVGLVEAMKVMNDIAAEIEGRVVQITAQNGQLVNEGEPLMLLAPFPARG